MTEAREVLVEVSGNSARPSGFCEAHISARATQLLPSVEYPEPRKHFEENAAIREVLPENGLGWKNNSDGTYSCPRGWHLSALWGPLKPLEHLNTFGMEGSKGGS